MGEAGMSRRALDCFQLLLLETHFSCLLWRLISTLALVIGKYSISWVAAPSLMESAKGSEACGFGVSVHFRLQLCVTLDRLLHFSVPWLKLWHPRITITTSQLTGLLSTSWGYCKD